MWVVQRYSDRVKAEWSRTGGGERQCVLCVWASDRVIQRKQNGVGLAAASASVCCVWASDSDRAKAERSGTGGGERQCVLCVGQ
jgi:hypothetical protein